jgi:hypothetical protein
MLEPTVTYSEIYDLVTRSKVKLPVGLERVREVGRLRLVYCTVGIDGAPKEVPESRLRPVQQYPKLSIIYWRSVMHPIVNPQLAPV